MAKDYVKAKAAPMGTSTTGWGTKMAGGKAKPKTSMPLPVDRNMKGGK